MICDEWILLVKMIQTANKAVQRLKDKCEAIFDDEFCSQLFWLHNFIYVKRLKYKTL